MTKLAQKEIEQFDFVSNFCPTNNKKKIHLKKLILP